MTDFWSAGLKVQRDLLDAQKRSLDAGKAYVGTGQSLVAWQEAGQRVVQANMAVLKAWAGLWGGRG